MYKTKGERESDHALSAIMVNTPLTKWANKGVSEFPTQMAFATLFNNPPLILKFENRYLMGIERGRERKKREKKERKKR